MFKSRNLLVITLITTLTALLAAPAAAMEEIFIKKEAWDNLQPTEIKSLEKNTTLIRGDDGDYFVAFDEGEKMILAPVKIISQSGVFYKLKVGAPIQIKWRSDLVVTLGIKTFNKILCSCCYNCSK